ncbi:ABC transporter permease [Kribbella sp. NPDC050124]|uniref:ABC transporter permease n=1 Tax=Kribbella sp. NPDC050124 TaxID=3364114 RepID=UPI00378DE6E9
MTTVEAPEAEASQAKARSPLTAWQDVAERFGIVIVWGMLIAVFAAIGTPYFLTTGTFQTILGSQAVLVIVALALMIPMIVNEFDLSIAGAMSVSLTLVGWLNVVHHWPLLPTLIVALLSGVVIGLLNALFVVGIGVDSIVVTLGAGTLWVGVGYGISAETIPGVSQTLVKAATRPVLGLPLAFWYAVALTFVLWYVLAFTPLGRFLYFVGANRSVSLLSGIPVTRIRVGALILSSFLAAFAGVVLAGTLGSSAPGVSESYLLPAFAAVFLGTTTWNPGKFNPIGTFIAVYFLITGITGLQLRGLTGWIEDVFYGGSLVVAVALSRLAARRR